MSYRVQFPHICYSISFVCLVGVGIGGASKQSGLIRLLSNLLTISFAIDCGLESVLSSLLPLRFQNRKTQMYLIIAGKQGVSIMHELYAMHVCIMNMLCNKQQVASIKSNIQVTNKVQHTSFQPYSFHTQIQWSVFIPRIFGLGFNINGGY